MALGWERGWKAGTEESQLKALSLDIFASVQGPIMYIMSTHERLRVAKAET